jgi:Serine/threonine protein phosphatase
MEIYSRTDKGMVRHSNQDAERHGFMEDGSAWAVVCDGMGGANGGNVASSTAVEEISARLKENYKSDMSASEIRDMIAKAVNAANIKVYIEAQEDITLRGMGTTVVVVIVRGETAYIAHAGDSRVYLYAKGDLRQMTVDHSVVQVMVDRGELTEQEARVHPRRNLITRALGVKPRLDIDHCECPVERGDILLLCSDGLSNYVEDLEMFKILYNQSGDKAVGKLIDTANAHGGGDNVTAVTVYC